MASRRGWEGDTPGPPGTIRNDQDVTAFMDHMTDGRAPANAAPSSAPAAPDAASPISNAASHPSWHAWTRWPPEPATGIPERVEEAFVLRVLDRIEADVSRVDDLEALAALAGLSLFHFHRRFAEVMGETVVAYGRRIRLEAAASRICRTPVPILAAAHAVGYGSQAAFTRAFSRRFGLTPNRLRALAAKVAPAPRLLHHDVVAQTQVVPQPEVTLLAMRFHGGFARVPGHWRQFGAELDAAGLAPKGDTQVGVTAVGLLHDDPALTPPAHMRFDGAVIDPDPSGPPPPAPFRRLVLRAGEMAELPLSGPPEVVPEALFGLCALWLPRAGRGLGPGPARLVHAAPPWLGDGAIEGRLQLSVG